MFRILTGILVIAGLVHAGAWYLYGSDDKDWAAIQSQADRLDQGLSNLRRFRMEMDMTCGEIMDENLPLAQAVEQVETSALTYQPIYLRTVKLLKKGISLKVQIAYNLLQNFDCRDASPEQRKVANRLHKEFVELCRANHEAVP